MICYIVQRVDDKRAATKKVILRSIKLFLLGIVLQGNDIVLS